MTYQSNFNAGQDAANASKAQFTKSAITGIAGVIAFMATAAIATNLGMVPAISAAVVLAGLFAVWTYFGSGSGDVGSIEDERIKKAMQSCQQNVMIADADFTISYMNATMVEMMRDAERDLQAELSNFNASSLLGSNMDIFHKNPSYQRSLLERLTHPHKTKLTVGVRSFSLIASPIFDDLNQRIGTVVEWEDLSVATAAEREKEAAAKASAELAESSGRIQGALDKATTNVLVTDADFNIAYINESLTEMLTINEAELRKEVPGFDLGKLMGANMDIFHKDKSHQRRLLEGLRDTFKTEIKVGELTFGLIATPLFDDSGTRTGVIVEWEDKTAALAEAKTVAAAAAENSRIRAALDNATTNVLVTDGDFNIRYINEALTEMLKGNEGELKKEVPGFNINKLMGANMDIFHKDKSHQRRLLEGLKETYKTNIGVGSLTFGLIATPIFDDAGERTSVIVEWEDKTEVLAAAKEERAIASENLNIRSALDVATTNIMVADADFNISYLNESLGEMMKSNERTLREALPNFDAGRLLGTNMDVFHADPRHQRGLLETLTNTFKSEITVNGLIFGLVATPILDVDGKRQGMVVEWEDRTAMRAQEKIDANLAAENSRVKSALDVATTNVMIADADYNIAYMNTALEGMMREAESELRKELPNFNASTLSGTNMDVFHKNPAHQRAMMENLKATYETDLRVGTLHFKLIASPVFGADGERVGTVVEWGNETAEKNIEQEIQTVVDAVAQGDFTNSINLDGKEGFMLGMAKNINAISDTVDAVTKDVGRMLQALAQGDLTQRIDKDYGGVFGQLKDDANATSDKLRETVTAISEASTEVSSGAEEITQGASDLSQRTEQQAANLEETAASMEEMASTIKQNADNSDQASSLATSARDSANKGGEVVGEAVTAMGKIEDSSKKISDIIGVIDEIAFQTNLLALNAAVEAARAGDAGRGFAVVASEVRSLAQRSAQAAKDIKDLINESSDQVKGGVELVNQTGESLKDIVDSIRKVADIVAEISAASNEQATGADEINSAITQMDEMTQQNSALVEENASAAKAMTDQANDMTRRLGFFNTGSGGGGVAAPKTQLRTVKSGSGGGARAMQANLAERVVEEGDDWSEF